MVEETWNMGLVPWPSPLPSSSGTTYTSTWRGQTCNRYTRRCRSSGHCVTKRVRGVCPDGKKAAPIVGSTEASSMQPQQASEAARQALPQGARRHAEKRQQEGQGDDPHRCDGARDGVSRKG